MANKISDDLYYRNVVIRFASLHNLVYSITLLFKRRINHRLTGIQKRGY